MSRDLTAKWLRQQTPPYRNADRVYVDVLNALDGCTSLRPKTDVYTYDDGRTQLLLCLHGLLPIAYRSATYNIPVAIWLTHAYPQEPPIVYVVPTSDMLVKPSKQVDHSGKCDLEYTANWRRKPDTCSLTALLEAMQDLFSRQPPLYAKPRSNPQPAPPESVSPASVRGPPNTIAQPPASDHGHVHPPVIPPKPQPAHAATVLGIERPPESSRSHTRLTDPGGLADIRSPSSVPPVAGPAPPTFAARDISYSTPTSIPQTPQTYPYANTHLQDTTQPPPVPPHPRREYASAPAGPSSSTVMQMPVTALPQGHSPVPPLPSSHPQPYFPVAQAQAQGPGYSSPPPYVAPPSAVSQAHGGSYQPTAASASFRPPTPPARPPIPQYGHERTAPQQFAAQSSPLSPQTSGSGAHVEAAAAAAPPPPHRGAITGFNQQFQTSQPQRFSSQVQYASPTPPIIAPVPANVYSIAPQIPGSSSSVSPQAAGGLPIQPGTISQQYNAYGIPPQPIPMRPAPSLPPPDLLDEDDDPTSPVHNFTPVDAPPRPPNPQTVLLHNTLLNSLRLSLSLLSQSVADTTARQRAMQAELLLGPAAIKDESARLVAVRDVCLAVASRWREVVTEGERRIAEVRRRGEVDVDEFVCATSIVGNQLINLVAEDNAIEDTMYHLHRALNSGRIDLERFLRTTRVLAEEQFMKRALVEKILNGLPMGMSMG